MAPAPGRPVLGHTNSRMKLVAASIMMVGGIVMSLRLDVQLSGLLLAVLPALVIGIALIVARMRPLFRAMQTNIDEVNRVMREQITGIRVIRAFVSEPQEGQRFGIANDELTETSLRASRIMAFTFPTIVP